MRQTTQAIIASAFLVACTAEPGKNTSYNSSGFDEAKDEAAAHDVVVAKNENTIRGTPPFIIKEAQVTMLLDSLLGEGSETRLRWAQGITNTWPRSDGALSEALSQGGLEYTQEHTAEFLRYIVASDSAMGTWADLISGELMIIAEAAPFDSLAQYKHGLHKRCGGCTADEKSRLTRFTETTGERLHAKAGE